MKRVLLGAAAVAAFTSAALAADLPSRRAPVVYVPPPVPSFTWEGLYFGLNAGADFNTYDSYRITGVPPLNALVNGAAGVGAALPTLSPSQINLGAGVRDPFLVTRSTGFAGGGQVGYNFVVDGSLAGFGDLGFLTAGLKPYFASRTGAVVFGVEADIDGTTNKASGLYIGTGNVASSYHSRNDFVGTLRGRLGYAFGNVYVYGTAGLAYADVRQNVVFRDNTGAPTGQGSSSGLRAGVAYGGGIEYAIPTASFVNFFKASAVTVKAEFIHYDLGSKTTTFAADGDLYNVRNQEKGNLARIGVNYKFGGVTPAPVVARY